MTSIGDIEIASLTGQTTIKVPGSINGETVALKSLTDCTVYLLDYSSEVEVTNCSNCQIFIGPVDGPAIFDACTGCNITVACQQFQAKNCSDMDFGLYCSTQPTLKDSMEIRVACWMGAYPGLTNHFATANLDPTRNQWNKMNDLSSEEGLLQNFVIVDQPEYWEMNDLSSEEGLLQNFVIVDQPEYWEVPLEGAGPPENPVPSADGLKYGGGGSGVIPTSGAASAAATPRAEADESLFSMPTDNGHVPLSNGNGMMQADDTFGSAGLKAPVTATATPGMNPKADDTFGSASLEAPVTATATPGVNPKADDTFGTAGLEAPVTATAMPGVNPKVAAMQKEMRERLAAQEELEQKTKTDLGTKARTYLSGFYDKRSKATAKKHENNRTEEANPMAQGPQGLTGWEKTVNMIDFGFNRPNGADLARYKSILFTAKAKNMPVGGASPGANLASPLA